MDEAGRVVLECEQGAGVIDDRDSETLSSLIVDAHGAVPDDDALIESLDRIQAGASASVRLQCAGATIAIEPIAADEVAARLGFVADPQPLPGERSGS
jgi:hypothetical protein